MTADEPVEGKCKECLHTIAFHHGGGCTVTSWGHRCTCKVETFASPSVPVESREQPSDPSGGHFRPQQWWRDYVAELRAEVAHQQDGLDAAAGFMLRYRLQLDELLAERDRARDLAAHLRGQIEALCDYAETLGDDMAWEPFVTTVAIRAALAALIECPSAPGCQGCDCAEDRGDD